MCADGHRDDQDWTRPGLHPVAPGVHRIPLPLPSDALRAVNVYAIEDGDALVLVDSGWALAEAREQLATALAGLGCGLADVRRFLVTHVHRDHYTQAVALRREFGAHVALGKGEQPSLEAILAVATGRRPLEAQLSQLSGCGAGPVRDRLLALMPDQPVDAGDWGLPDEWLTQDSDTGLTTRTLRVLPTPGHTQGHVVFLDQQAGLLFAGDHVLPHITPSIGFEAVPAELTLGDYLASLRLVRGLPDALLLPAHGPVTTSAHERIDQLLDHHHTRLTAAATAVAAGASTAYEVAATLRWTGRGRTLAELDPFNQMLAVLETAAHLDLLTAQNRLHVGVVDGVTHYAVS